MPRPAGVTAGRAIAGRRVVAIARGSRPWPDSVYRAPGHGGKETTMADRQRISYVPLEAMDPALDDMRARE